eukprot:Phypoly_transcript_05740.p1 GENE.Phypoly_transcript_05740~~Phypoly_transcript_05740.p1  ORF type:complete len:541 (+),score=136.62 Phypoly_transcript_05740:126-1748(+)
MSEAHPYTRKACGPCIALKAKCTHTRPCERCVRRGVECVDVVRKPRQKKPKVPVTALQILSQLLPTIDPLDLLKLQNIPSTFTPPPPVPDISDPLFNHSPSPPSPALSPPLSPPSSSVPSPPFPPMQSEPLPINSEFFGNSDIFQEFGVCTTTDSLPQPDSLQTHYVTPPNSASPPSSPPQTDHLQKCTTTSSSSFLFAPPPEDDLQTCTSSSSFLPSPSSSFLPSPSLPDDLQTASPIFSSEPLPLQTDNSRTFTSSSSFLPSSSDNLQISTFAPTDNLHISTFPPIDNLQISTFSPADTLQISTFLSTAQRADFSPAHPQFEVTTQITNPAGLLSSALLNLLRKLATGTTQEAHAQVVAELQHVKNSVEQFLAYAESSRPKEINNNPALYIMDPQNLIVRDCNDNFLKLVGWKKENIQGIHVGKLCVPFFWRVVKRDIDWFRARGIVRGERYIAMRHANGGIVYSMGHFQLLSQNYSVMTLGAIYEDVPRCLQIAFHHYLGLTSSNKVLQSSPDCQLSYCHCKMIHLPMPTIDFSSDP